MGANTSKEHHLVPKYWLRAFAEDGHVLARRRGGAEHRTPVRRAAVARDFNTDPLAEGKRRVALETYLDHHVDGPSALVLRALREGRAALEDVQEAVVLDALTWQVVGTQAFRSFDAQVGHRVFPAVWAAEAVAYCEERLGRPLSEAERTAPDPSVVADPRSVLRACIRAFERAREVLAAPGRRLVLLHSGERLLMLADSGVAPRKDGTYSLTPPLLTETTELFAPLSPSCLLSPRPALTTGPTRASPARLPPRPTPGQQPGARMPSTGCLPCPGPLP